MLLYAYVSNKACRLLGSASIVRYEFGMELLTLRPQQQKMWLLNVHWSGSITLGDLNKSTMMVPKIQMDKGKQIGAVINKSKVTSNPSNYICISTLLTLWF